MRLDLRSIAEAAAYDPAKPLWDAAGDLGDYVVNDGILLIATYIAPPKVMKNADGSDFIFHRTDKGMQEDRFQGKVGLVLKAGPYPDDFHGLRPEAGDWVMYRPSDAMELFIRDRRTTNDGLSSRLLDARFVFMIVTDPSLIY